MRADNLDATMRGMFAAKYSDEITRGYPARSDGTVMLKFPRLFIAHAIAERRQHGPVI